MRVMKKTRKRVRLHNVETWTTRKFSGVEVPGRGGLEYLGERGWSTWERVGVPGRGGLEYLGEGGWSTWWGGVGVPANSL